MWCTTEEAFCGAPQYCGAPQDRWLWLTTIECGAPQSRVWCTTKPGWQQYPGASVEFCLKVIRLNSLFVRRMSICFLFIQNNFCLVSRKYREIAKSFNSPSVFCGGPRSYCGAPQWTVVHHKSLWCTTVHHKTTVVHHIMWCRAIYHSFWRFHLIPHRNVIDISIYFSDLKYMRSLSETFFCVSWLETTKNGMSQLLARKEGDESSVPHRIEALGFVVCLTLERNIWNMT